MNLTFLGTGSAMPTGERFQTGLLFEAGDDVLQVDCGSGAVHSLQRTDVGYEGVETILLTHHHLDHVADLLPHLKARWLAGTETLTVVGPAGTPDLVEGLLDVHEYLQGRVELTLEEVAATDGAGNPHEIAGFEIHAMETRHSLPCLAYRVTHPASDATVTFSGDSEAFPELIEFAADSTVLVHDCSFPDDVDVSNHPTPSSLGAALAAADVDLGRVYLTHRYPHTEGREEEMGDSIADHYDGDLRFAEDGLSLSLSGTA